MPGGLACGVGSPCLEAWGERRRFICPGAFGGSGRGIFLVPPYEHEGIWGNYRRSGGMVSPDGRGRGHMVGADFYLYLEGETR